MGETFTTREYPTAVKLNRMFARLALRAEVNEALEGKLSSADLDGKADAADVDALRGRVRSLADFGGIGDDATNNDAAIASAIASGAPTIRVPLGVFRHNTPFQVPDGQQWVGEGFYYSLLRSTFLSGDCITLGAAASMRGIGFNSTGQRTSGLTVKLAGNGATLAGFSVDNAYLPAAIIGSGVSSLVVGATIADGIIRQNVGGAGSGAVDVHHFANATVRNLVVTGTETGPQCDFGVRVRNGDTCFVSGVNATRVGRSLYVSPGVNENTFSLNVSGSYFDSAVGCSSAEFRPAGTIRNTLISNTWFGLAEQNGLVLQPLSGGTVDGITLTGCEFPGNGVSGMTAAGTNGNVRNIVVTGGHAAANPGAGLYFDGVQDFVVQGFRAGNVAQRGPNGYGIVVTGAANGFAITGCNLRGNTTGGLVNTASPSPSSSVIANNLLT